MAEKLTPRLMQVANYIPDGARLADIGTDHAHLPIALIRARRIPRAIASDIKIGPVEIARRNVKAAFLVNQIEVRLGAGLEPVSAQEADCVAIAGMGGETIAQILSDAQREGKQFGAYILQPMSMVEKLREYLLTHGFSIRAEKLAREGEKLYVVLKAVPGGEREDDPFYYWIGRRLVESRDPLLKDDLLQKIRACEQTILGMKQAAALQESLLEQFEQRLSRMKALLEEAKTW